MFAIVKRYYDMKIYSTESVAKFVKASKITPEQYKQITGQDYIAV